MGAVQLLWLHRRALGESQVFELRVPLQFDTRMLGHAQGRIGRGLQLRRSAVKAQLPARGAMQEGWHARRRVLQDAVVAVQGSLRNTAESGLLTWL